MRHRSLLGPALALLLAACTAQTAQEARTPTPTMTPRPTFTSTPRATATPVATATPMATPTPVATDTPEPEPTPTPQIHVVRAGETLSGIAEAYGVSLSALIEANDITNPSLVLVGQELIIPSS
ncbi:MAG: LysM peptidoglycan-binding domain-containing protein [Anaerolineae bacterium]|nr:LysM peptidoglycan-binding domain-containing protein [Anaerolineae bacterium]